MIASQSGHRLPPLTVEQNIALATTPVEELLDLPFLHLYQVTAITRREVPRPGLGFKSAAAPPRESLPHVPHLFPMYSVRTRQTVASVLIGSGDWVPFSQVTAHLSVIARARGPMCC